MSFISERYHDSMRTFTQMLKSYQQIQDAQQLELLLQEFWTEEDRMTAHSRSWGTFRCLCRTLDEAGAISSAVRFMWGVFHRPDRYDRAAFQKTLSAIRLTPELNLAELCSGVFLSYAAKMRHLSVPEMDVYQDDLSRCGNLSVTSTGTLTLLLPGYLSEKIYGVSLDPATVTTEEVDRLAEAILARTRVRTEDENRRIAIENEDFAQMEAEALAKGIQSVHFPRQALKTLTEFEQQYAIPGGLLELYLACELINRNDICYYILETYVWPVFAITPWEADHSEQVQILAGLAGVYADAMFSQLIGKDPVLNKRHLVETDYTEDQFFAELSGQAEGAILRGGKQRYEGHGCLALAIRDTLQRGHEVLKARMDDYLYSFLMSVTPYMLLSTGQEDAAADFLVRYYDEISLYDKRLLYVQVLLTRCILSTKHLEAAYTLYGHYTHEMDRQERDRERISRVIRDIIAYLRRTKEYIRQCNEYTIRTKRSWYELLFDDGRIEGLLNNIGSELDRGVIPEEHEFRSLLRVVEGFSHTTGIHLGILGLPDQDGYDKLEGALSQELMLQGKGYVKRSDEYLAFYHSMSRQELRRNVDTILQHHISQMVQKTLESSLKRVEQIRTSLQIENEGSEETLRKLEEVYTDLSLRLQKGYLGRPEVERHIDVLELTFREEYCADFGGRSLLAKLPPKLEQEIRNYLVTGEIVYRLLSSREDAEQLDFSAALIPLTKAVEQVLNHIYRQMNVQRYFDLDRKVEQNFFDNNGPKASIEFGPGLWLFKDAVYINVQGSPGAYSLSEGLPYRVPHFKQWGGDTVVDISALRRLGTGRNRKSLWVDRRDRVTGINCKTAVFFGTNDRQNRMLLAKGLEYIRDHHRNVVAHKDPVNRSMVDECRDILLLTEDVLWILLYILK